MGKSERGTRAWVIRDRWEDRGILRSLHEGRGIDGVASEISSEGKEGGR